MRVSRSAIEPSRERRGSSAVTQVAPTLSLFAASVLFMWMFFASKALERTADEGLLSTGGGVDVAAAADEYARLWRHGMVGGWPLYVPGFFAVAVAVSCWSRGKSLQALALRGAAISLSATVIAKALAPFGTDRLVPAFARSIGASTVGAPLRAPWTTAPLGLATIISWAALIVAVRVSLGANSVRPVILPLALYAGLAILRPGDLGELAKPWFRQFVRGDRVAVASTVLLIVGVVALWRLGRTEPRLCRHAAQIREGS